MTCDESPFRPPLLPRTPSHKAAVNIIIIIIIIIFFCLKKSFHMQLSTIYDIYKKCKNAWIIVTPYQTSKGTVVNYVCVHCILRECCQSNNAMRRYRYVTRYRVKLISAIQSKLNGCRSSYKRLNHCEWKREEISEAESNAQYALSAASLTSRFSLQILHSHIDCLWWLNVSTPHLLHTACKPQHSRGAQIHTQA